MKITVLPLSPYDNGPSWLTLEPETQAEVFQLDGVARDLDKFRALFDTNRHWNITSLSVKVKGKEHELPISRK